MDRRTLNFYGFLTSGEIHSSCVQSFNGSFIQSIAHFSDKHFSSFQLSQFNGDQTTSIRLWEQISNEKSRDKKRWKKGEMYITTKDRQQKKKRKTVSDAQFRRAIIRSRNL